MKTENNNKSINRCRNIILITAALAVTAVLLALLANKGIAVPCIFHKITGLYCPGCGNTRAALAIMHLRFGEAFEYNPLFIPEILYIGFVYIKSSLNYIKKGRFSYRTPSEIFDYSMLTIIIIWGVVRNLIM